MSSSKRLGGHRARTDRRNQDELHGTWDGGSSVVYDFLSNKKSSRKKRGKALDNSSLLLKAPALKKRTMDDPIPKKNHNPLKTAQELQNESHIPLPPSQREQSRSAQSSKKSTLDQLLVDVGSYPSQGRKTDSQTNSRKINTRNQRPIEIAGKPRNPSRENIVNLCDSDEDSSDGVSCENIGNGKTPRRTTPRNEARQQKAASMKPSDAPNTMPRGGRSKSTSRRAVNASRQSPPATFEGIFEEATSVSKSNRKRKSAPSTDPMNEVLVDTDDEESSETTWKESARSTTKESLSFQPTEAVSRRGRSPANCSKEMSPPSPTKRRKRIDESKEEDHYSEAMSSRTSTPGASDSDAQVAHEGTTVAAA